MQKKIEDLENERNVRNIAESTAANQVSTETQQAMQTQIVELQDAAQALASQLEHTTV